MLSGRGVAAAEGQTRRRRRWWQRTGSKRAPMFDFMFGVFGLFGRGRRRHGFRPKAEHLPFLSLSHRLPHPSQTALHICAELS